MKLTKDKVSFKIRLAAFQANGGADTEPWTWFSFDPVRGSPVISVRLWSYPPGPNFSPSGPYLFCWAVAELQDQNNHQAATAII